MEINLKQVSQWIAQQRNNNVEQSCIYIYCTIFDEFPFDSINQNIFFIY